MCTWGRSAGVQSTATATPPPLPWSSKLSHRTYYDFYHNHLTTWSNILPAHFRPQVTIYIIYWLPHIYQQNIIYEGQFYYYEENSQRTCFCLIMSSFPRKKIRTNLLSRVTLIENINVLCLRCVCLLLWTRIRAAASWQTVITRGFNSASSFSPINYSTNHQQILAQLLYQPL